MQLRKRSDKVSSTLVDDEMVLLDLESGKFFELRDTGLAIWRALDGTGDLTELCQKLAGEYDVDPQLCQEETERFARQLAAAGFVELVE